jgi:hypothetical protein
MDEFCFPPYVEAFIEATDQYLKFFDAKLEKADEDPKIEMRLYMIATGGDPVELIVHRTARSFEQAVGEYRSRAYARITGEVAGLSRGREHLLNRFATLGALATTEEGASVACQCLIQPDFKEAIAGILAAALIHARPSIMESVLERETTPPIEQLSAWSDLDFEQLQYDYAHLGIGELRTRGLAMNLLNGILSFDALHNNPYWGGGLLCLSRLPQKLLNSDNTIDINSMNIWDNTVSDTPLFGGWCRDGNDVVFTQFIPNMMKGLPDVAGLLIEWSRRRLAFAPQLVELSRKRYGDGDDK